MGGTQPEARCVTCDTVLSGSGENGLYAALAHGLPHDVSVIITREQAALIAEGEIVNSVLTAREGDLIRSLANPQNHNAKHFINNG